MLAEACAAYRQAADAEQAIKAGDALALIRSWDETWHPIMAPTSLLLKDAQELVLRDVAALPAPVGIKVERIGPDRIRLRWLWPPRPGRDRFGPCETMVIRSAYANGDGPLLTVFRAPSEEVATVELAHAGPRFVAELAAGCCIGGETFVSRNASEAAEDKLALHYRLSPITDSLHLQADRQTSVPALRVVHARSHRSLITVKAHDLLPTGRSEFSLARLAGARTWAKQVTRKLRSLRNSDDRAYTLELAAPDSDGDFIEIVHPIRGIDRQLSFGPASDA